MNLIKSFIFAILALLSTMLFQVQAKTIAEGWMQNGVTSFYHRSLNGNKTASGERYKHYNAMTAAHRSLPFGTKIQVTDKISGKSIIVKVNDRGPFHGNRVLDLSGKAARELGIIKQGVCEVEIKVLSVPEKSRSKRNVFKENRIDAISELIAASYDKDKL